MWNNTFQLAALDKSKRAMAPLRKLAESLATESHDETVPSKMKGGVEGEIGQEKMMAPTTR